MVQGVDLGAAVANARAEQQAAQMRAAMNRDRIGFFKLELAGGIFKEMVVAMAAAEMQKARDKEEVYGENPDGGFGIDFSIPLQVSMQAAELFMQAAVHGVKPAEES